MLRGKELLLILFYFMCMSVVCVSVVCVSVVCVSVVCVCVPKCICALYSGTGGRQRLRSHISLHYPPSCLLSKVSKLNPEPNDLASLASQLVPIGS